jgi:hypothetical protein
MDDLDKMKYYVLSQVEIQNQIQEGIFQSYDRLQKQYDELTEKYTIQAGQIHQLQNELKKQS